MTGRQLAAQATRTKLLRAGKTIICQKGLEHTSVEEITEAAGVSKGTFYTYFRRKEDIVFELSRGMFGEILAEAKSFPGTFPEKLARYMSEFSGYIQQGSVRLAQEWVKGAAFPADCREKTDRGKLAEDLRDMEELIRYGMKQGMLREDTPAGILAHTFVDLLYGQLLCWCMSDGSYSLKERTEEFCAEYLEDLLKDYVCG